MVIGIVSKEDVLVVAKDLKIKLSEKQIEDILNEYPEAQENDPTATWDLIIEDLIYQIQ